jgi:phosphatidylglycerophosphatase A
MDRTAVHLATLGPIGYLRPAPGTWGSVAAALAAPFLLIPLPVWLRGFVLVLVSGAGVLAAGRAEHALQCKDPRAVVIDEFAGQLLVFLLIPEPDPLTLAVGLVLFRLFDITKPWPVGASEAWFSGGAGIMVDDILAGGYALLGLHLLLALF